MIPSTDLRPHSTSPLVASVFPCSVYFSRGNITDKLLLLIYASGVLSSKNVSNQTQIQHNKSHIIQHVSIAWTANKGPTVWRQKKKKKRGSQPPTLNSPSLHPLPIPLPFLSIRPTRRVSNMFLPREASPRQAPSQDLPPLPLLLACISRRLLYHRLGFQAVLTFFRPFPPGREPTHSPTPTRLKKLEGGY